ncbi:heavy-metal-associated domain-containing protein [Nitrogeniibacter aestuarii]|uniref:heavy-metal-associated domain-containing protein n=1 Tax=Nitrogeniibacter aestuarii TaxID=2815343 RepID=UPI001E4D79FB|nr:heavy-metal-associated domain-containing protein [Nitrogeniibacter aestuarii]
MTPFNVWQSALANNMAGFFSVVLSATTWPHRPAHCGVTGHILRDTADYGKVVATNAIQDYPMPTTEFTIDGLKTDDDLRTVMNAIQDLPCISHSEVDMSTGAAWVEHTSMLSEGEIRGAVEEAGFTTR